MEGRAGSGWELLRTRNFGLLFSGQTISQIGDSMNKVALLWFVYELTGSAFKMAVIGMLQSIPPLVFGPLIGVYLDRMQKKPVMLWVDLIRTGLILLIPLLYSLEALTLERLYVLVFVISIVSTVFGPALASSIPLLAPRAQLTAANALIQSTTNIGLLIGPAVSGIGITMIGAHNVLYLNAATFMVSAMCLMPIRLRETLQTRAQMAIIVFGGSTAVFTPIVWAMLQELTPAPLLGRVFTTFSTGTMAPAMAGMAGFGWLADALGPAASIVGIGMLLLGTAAVVALFSRGEPDRTALELLAA